MQRSIKVLVAENEGTDREQLKKLLADEDDVQVLAEVRDGKECLDQVAKLQPDIVLLKRELPVINGLDVAEQLNSEHSGVNVILLLNGKENEEVWHRMLRAGIRQFVSRPYDPVKFSEELRKCITDLDKAAKKPGSSPSETPASPANRVIAVTGPRGGCGKSIIATNLAVAMARESERIALVDLNLWGGDIAMLLDLTPRRTLGDLLPGFGGIDNDVVESVITKHSSGVSVIAAPMTGQFDGTTLSRYIVQSILDSLRDHYECTIVDTGYANLESTLAAMDAADTILVVVGTDLPRLRDGKHYLKNLLAANYPKEKLRVVVNRTSGGKEISPAEIETILEFPVTARIPNDDSLVGSSVNLGQPFVASNPSKPSSKTLFALAEAILPAPAETSGKKRSGARWFSFLH